MIGWELGRRSSRKGGGPSFGVRDEEQSSFSWRDVWDTHVAPILEPIWDWVSRMIEVAVWVLERIAEVYGVDWERWTTHADERVCPECGPRDGESWPEGEGAFPPLHVNCRCGREYAFTEWRTRYVDAWRLHWEPRTVWDWEMTGWG